MDFAAVKQSMMDFSQPTNVEALDQVCRTFYTSVDMQMRSAAEDIMRSFQEHPDAWTRVDNILEKAQDSNTKFFALQVG